MAKRGTHRMTEKDYKHLYSLAAELEAINSSLRYLAASNRPAEIETCFVDAIIETADAWRDDLRARARERTKAV